MGGFSLAILMASIVMIVVWGLLDARRHNREVDGSGGGDQIAGSPDAKPDPVRKRPPRSESRL